MTLRRTWILVLLFAFSASFPAGAQDIFLKHGQASGAKKPAQEAATEEEPSIYVKPKKLKNSPAAGVSYKDHVYNSELQKASKLKMATLEDWRKSGLTPETPDEIRAYANASRAVSQSVMYKRREALMTYLEKQQFKKINASAQKKAPRAKAASSPVVQAKDQPASGGGQKPVYVKPADKAKSKKVFSSY